VPALLYPAAENRDRHVRLAGPNRFRERCGVRSRLGQIRVEE
jgi:hypothetical protein